jgi:hypothetical protein
MIDPRVALWVTHPRRPAVQVTSGQPTKDAQRLQRSGCLTRPTSTPRAAALAWIAMPLSDEDCRQAAALIAQMSEVAQQLYAGRELSTDQVEDLWGTYFAAQTELEQLIMLPAEPLHGPLLH